MIDDLYTARILALAANMPRAGRLAAPGGSAERVSRLCGSRVIVDVVVQDGRVVDFAQEVRACALGQAAAAILGENVMGATVQEIESGRDELRRLLLTGGPGRADEVSGARFADLRILAQVKDYPARHASTLLAFEAAVEATRAASLDAAGPNVKNQARGSARSVLP